MGAALALLALALSLAPTVVVSLGGPQSAGALSGAGIALSPLALLPWLALGSLPRGPDARAARSSRSWIPSLGLSLPALALAIRLDLAEGRAIRELGWTAGGGLLLAALLAEAARPGGPERAPLGRRPSSYPRLWFLLIAVPPALALALGSVAQGRAGGASWAAEVCAQTPLGWLAGRALEPASGGAPVGPVAIALLLLAAAHFGRRRPVPEESP